MLSPAIADPQTLKELVRHKRVLISVGAGGVGKTTTAAALGLLAASLGRKTLVLTIDPARRLAASLGIDLDHQERAVPADKLAAVGIAPDLLHATMLDQKATFDELIRRQAPSAETVQRILKNKLYRELSTRLAGGQEYAAMEKLYELVHHKRYDLLILDTPPTANALDFLDAPTKMVEMVDSPAISLFVRSYKQAGRFSFKLLTLGAAYIFRRLARFVGGEFLDDLAQYFSDMSELLQGFRERAAKVVDLLQRQDVGFVIVASADPRAIDEGIALVDRLAAGKMSAAGIVINRVVLPSHVQLDEHEVATRLGRAGLVLEQAERLAPALLAAQRRVNALAQGDEAEIQRLLTHCQPAPRCVRVPLFEEDVHDIDGLHRLASHL